MGYVRRDQHLVITAGRTSQKVANLRRDPRASFLVERTEPYYSTCGVMVTGPVELRDDRAYTATIARDTLLKHPHDLKIDPERLAEVRLCILIDIAKVRSWGRPRLWQTYIEPYAT